MTIEEQLSEFQGEATRLRADLAAAQQLADEANTRAATAETAVGEARTAVASAQEQNTAHTARIATLEAEAQSAEDRAREIVAQLGQPPMGRETAAPGTAATKTLSEQFAAISDPAEKTKFYRANKDALNAEILRKN